MQPDLGEWVETRFADVYSRPSFQMGPYDNAAFTRNAEALRGGDREEADFEALFGRGEAHILTSHGRSAIALAVASLGLGAQDEVLILTTSGSPYVSACVTEAIATRCRPSRVLGKRTAALFLIHEFGYPASIPEELKDLDLPVIEDCAYALGGQNAEGTMGEIGDLVVYSLSKALPIPFGGLLKVRAGRAPTGDLDASEQTCLRRLLAEHAPELPQAVERRRALFARYEARFARAGFSSLFACGPRTAPHAFVVALEDQARAERMKPRLQAAGIISSVFYGGGGYFLPLHAALSDAAVDYIVWNFLEAHAAS